MLMPIENSNSSFLAFIDEAGCEKGAHGKGGSEWFVLSAVVMRRDTAEQAFSVFEELREEFSKDKGWNIKFGNMQPKHKIYGSRLIAKRPVRIASVIVHKNSISSAELQRDHYKLYFYVGKYLVERISWICRDYAHKCTTGDGTVHLIFSKRSKYPYEDFQEYLQKLREGGNNYNSSTDWERIIPSQIDAIPHYLSHGCTLADFAASATALALEYTERKITDERPIRELRNVTYKPSSGLKFWPKSADDLLGDASIGIGHRLDWYKHYYK